MSGNAAPKPSTNPAAAVGSSAGNGRITCRSAIAISTSAAVAPSASSWLRSRPRSPCAAADTASCTGPIAYSSAPSASVAPSASRIGSQLRFTRAAYEPAGRPPFELARLRQYVSGPLAALPRRHGRLDAVARDVLGAVHERAPVDVARAVREHRAGAHMDRELRALPRHVVADDRRAPLHAQPAAPLEVDEQQADLGIAGEVAHREVHPVAVVVRERQRAVVQHPHEAGVAALVGARRA